MFSESKSRIDKLCVGDNMADVSVAFGILSDPIIEQLWKQGLDMQESDAKRIQNLSDALNLIWLHGLISDGIGHTARKRIMKDIMKCVYPLESACR